MQKAGFAVVGIRNFASNHIKNIRKIEKEGLGKLTGVVVEDQLKNADKVRELKKKGINIFSTYDELLKKGRKSVDIITLPTSIHTHAELAIKGMEHGYNILMEKPPTPTIEQMDKLIETVKETGKFCSVGFQFIHSRSIRKLKKMIIDGKLGDIKEIACKGFWPRFKSYYDRNPWAGRSIWNGQLVLDGPMHNAFAHYLNNMLFLASKRGINETAEIKTVRAELYRAHTYIEADDTSCMEIETTQGTKIYFYVTHAPEIKRDPYLEIVGTEGRAIWQYDETTRLELSDGQQIEFDNDGLNPKVEVFRVAARRQAKEIKELYCIPETTRNFVIGINGAYESAQNIIPIPETYVREYTTENGEYKTVLQDIDNQIDKAFNTRKLLSDLNIPWARSSKTVNVENYSRFTPFLEDLKEG